MDFTSSRVHLLIGKSQRLRREFIDELLQSWSGTIDRSVEPSHLQEVIMAAETPSLFGDASLALVAASEQYLSKHAAMLKQHIGIPGTSGCVIIHSDKIPQKGGLRQAAQKASALMTCNEPSNKAREMQQWLRARLESSGCEGSEVVAQALLHHRGNDLDTLLSTIDVLDMHAGEQPISIKDVHAVVAGQAEEPMYKFADAFFNGESKKALTLLHAGRGIDAQPAINTLINEIRKLLCASEWSDPDDIAYHAGIRYKLNDYACKAIRQRALGMGKRCLLRLLTGLQQAQRDLRKTGSDSMLVLETLILNASRVIRSRS